MTYAFVGAEILPPIPPMKTEQQSDHAKLEKLILSAALTCFIAMAYLLTVSI